MRTINNEWTVEYPGDGPDIMTGGLVTISNGERKVTTIVCADNTGLCDECCIKKVFGLATCQNIPVNCINHHFELVEDIL